MEVPGFAWQDSLLSQQVWFLLAQTQATVESLESLLSLANQLKQEASLSGRLFIFPEKSPSRRIWSGNVSNDHRYERGLPKFSFL